MATTSNQKSKSKKVTLIGSKQSAVLPGIPDLSSGDELPLKSQNPHWPTPGILPNSSSLRPTNSPESTTFDYERINSMLLHNGEDIEEELWIVRVPKGVKPKALESLSVDASAFPPGSSERTHVKVGTMDRKNAKYDVWSIAEHSDTRNASSPEYDIESEESLIGGQEILGLQCLLPRRSNGKLQLAPKMNTRYILLCLRPVLPTPPASEPSSSNDDENTRHANPPRYRHPSHLLKHRFLPTGALSVSDMASAGAAPDVMEIDSSIRPPTVDSRPESTVNTESGDTPKKKRKLDGERDREGKKKGKKTRAAV